jgi:hypothetical protein
VKWNETRSATLSDPAIPIPENEFYCANSVRALHSDVATLGKHVIFVQSGKVIPPLSWVMQRIHPNLQQFGVALLTEILMPTKRPFKATHICLQRMEFQSDLHPTLKLPMMSLSNTEIVVASNVCPIFHAVPVDR